MQKFFLSWWNRNLQKKSHHRSLATLLKLWILMFPDLSSSNIQAIPSFDSFFPVLAVIESKKWSKLIPLAFSGVSRSAIIAYITRFLLSKQREPLSSLGSQRSRDWRALPRSPLGSPSLCTVLFSFNYLVHCSPKMTFPNSIWFSTSLVSAFLQVQTKGILMKIL